jgi:hypothetical protein
LSEAITAFGQINGGAQFLLFLLFGCVLRILLHVVVRGYRAIMVSRHGWPPPHLDADGDFKPKDVRG